MPLCVRHAIIGLAAVLATVLADPASATGTADNFTYSDAMKQSRIVWDDATLAKYLRNPKEFIPGNKMAFPGVSDDKQIADLLAYLHQATQ